MISPWVSRPIRLVLVTVLFGFSVLFLSLEKTLDVGMGCKIVFGAEFQSI